jgi:hypothetical protein
MVRWWVLVHCGPGSRTALLSLDAVPTNERTTTQHTEKGRCPRVCNSHLLTYLLTCYDSFSVVVAAPLPRSLPGSLDRSLPLVVIPTK